MANETRSARSGAPSTGHPVQRVGAQKGVFRKEGEYWTLGCSGSAFRLKDSKGLGYLAHLLRHPAAEFHVLDLVGGIASQREPDEPDQEERGRPLADDALEKARGARSWIGATRPRVKRRWRLISTPEHMEHSPRLAAAKRSLDGSSRSAAPQERWRRRSRLMTCRSVIRSMAQRSDM
jgi:hypothetical protein